MRSPRQRAPGLLGWQLILVLGLGAAPRDAAAHPPLRASGAVRSGSAVAVRTNRGLLIASESGTRLACPMGLGAFPSERLPVVATGQGGWLVGTAGGVVQLDARGCRETGPPRLAQPGVQDLVASTGAELVVAVSADAGAGSALFQSRDGGASFELVYALGPLEFFNSVALAAGGSSLYAAGERVVEDSSEHFIARSSGSESLELVALELEPGETRLRVLAVDPAQSDVLIAGAFTSSESSLPERLLRSQDGGRSWHTWQSVAGLNQLSFSADGQIAWLASEAGLWRSEQGGPFAGVTLERSPSCAQPEGDGLIVCDALGLQRSRDGAGSFEPLLRFADVTAPVSCDGSGAAVLECRADWEEFAAEQARAFGAAAAADRAAAPAPDAAATPASARCSLPGAPANSCAFGAVTAAGLALCAARRRLGGSRCGVRSRTRSTAGR